MTVVFKLRAKFVEAAIKSDYSSPEMKSFKGIFKKFGSPGFEQMFPGSGSLKGIFFLKNGKTKSAAKLVKELEQCPAVEYAEVSPARKPQKPGKNAVKDLVLRDPPGPIKFTDLVKKVDQRRAKK